jgi:tetratricopeptide (TPR) repeat protein
MTSRCLPPSVVALICVGSVLVLFGLYDMASITFGRPVAAVTRWRALELTLFGAGILLLAFPGKYSSAAAAITAVLSAAIGLVFYRVGRGLFGAVSGLIIPAGGLYVAGVGLQNLYAADWYPLVWLVARVAQGRWKPQYKLAKSYYRKNESSRAMDVVNSAKARGVASGWMDYLEGVLNLQMRNCEIARGILDKVVKADTSIPKAEYFLGMCYVELGQLTEAKNCLSRWLEHNAEDVPGLLLRGHVLVKMELYELAVSDYSRVLRIDPWQSDALYNRGVCYDHLGNLEARRADWTVAAALQTPNPLACFGLGHMAHGEGDIETAVALFAKGYAIDPALADEIPEELKSRIEKQVQ